MELLLSSKEQTQSENLCFVYAHD